MKPLRVLLCVFSQTGTTQKTAEHISEGLQQNGCEVFIHKIDHIPLWSLHEFDIIGIGSPVYIFRPPFTVMDFINSLPNLKGKSFFVFTLHGTYPGDGGNWIRRKMKMKEAVDLGYFRCHGADYFIGFLKKGYLFSPESPSKEELKAAGEFGALVARRHITNSHEAEKFDPPTGWVFAIERFSTNRLNAKTIYSRFFRINNTCNSCGICISQCPANNIQVGANGKPVWKSKCILCGTCELKCPKDAISSAFDWGIFSPFMNYNIQKAIKSGIPYVKIKHEAGKTIRID